MVDIDPGTRDLQQCADAVMRLRAEYLFSVNPDKIHFHLTTGYDAWFSDFVAGRTFRVKGESVLPAAKPAEAPTHAALGRYLLPVFGYAGTLSLSREVRPVPLAQVRPGDVLVHGGSPSHAVLVADVTTNARTGQRYILLAQSYMPAQSIHLLRNVDQPALGAWFAVPGLGPPSLPRRNGRLPARSWGASSDWPARGSILTRTSWAGNQTNRPGSSKNS